MIQTIPARNAPKLAGIIIAKQIAAREKEKIALKRAAAEAAIARAEQEKADQAAKKKKKKKKTKRKKKTKAKKGTKKSKAGEGAETTTTKERGAGEAAAVAESNNSGARAPRSVMPTPVFSSGIRSVSRVDRGTPLAIGAQCGQSATSSGGLGLFSGCVGLGGANAKNDTSGFSYSDLIFGLKKKGNSNE